jgi:hypothetical protein
MPRSRIADCSVVRCRRDARSTGSGQRVDRLVTRWHGVHADCHRWPGTAWRLQPRFLLSARRWIRLRSARSFRGRLMRDDRGCCRVRDLEKSLNFLMAYPLFVGPSILIVGNTDSHALLRAHCIIFIIFAPLDWARDHSKAVDNAYLRYIHLWAQSRTGRKNDAELACQTTKTVTQTPPLPLVMRPHHPRGPSASRGQERTGSRAERDGDASSSASRYRRGPPGTYKRRSTRSGRLALRRAKIKWFNYLDSESKRAPGCSPLSGSVAFGRGKLTDGG